jgi:hypothetical protein
LLALLLILGSAIGIYAFLPQIQALLGGSEGSTATSIAVVVPTQPATFTPAPSPTETPSPTVTPSETPTATPSQTPSQTPTVTPSRTARPSATPTRGSTPKPTNTPGQPGLTVPVTLINESGGNVCYVQMSLTTETTWGDDRMCSSEIINNGGSRVFDVPLGYYDIRALDCDEEVVDERRGVDLTSPYTWSIGEVAFLSFNLEPREGEVELAAGFLPQPYTLDMNVGGPVAAHDLELGPGCSGFTNPAPHLRLQWSGTAERLRIFFFAHGGADTTIIVNDPRGDWFCGDDSGGTTQPMVEFFRPRTGQYDIWVGTTQEGVTLSGTLYLTEEEWDPGNLP